MSKRLWIVILIVLLLAAGLAVFIFREGATQTSEPRTENDLAEFAAKLGRQKLTTESIATPLDLTQPLRLAIGGLGLTDTNLNLQLGDLVMADLSKAAGFQLVERSSLAAILAELNLTLNGFVRASQAVHVGKLLPVDWFLMGTETQLRGTNFIVARLVDARTGIMLDTELVVEKSAPALAVELANFVRSARQAAAEGHSHIYLAVGGFEDLSVNNRLVDFPQQLQGYLIAAYRQSKVTLLEREYVDVLLQEERLDLAGLTEDSSTHPRVSIQPAFWLVDGDYQSYETTNRTVELNLEIHRIFGRAKRFYLHGQNDVLFTQVRQTIESTMAQDAGIIIPTRASETQAQLNKGMELAGVNNPFLLGNLKNQMSQGDAASRLQHNLEEAIQSFQTVLLLSPTNHEAKFWLAGCLESYVIDQKDAARDYYRQIIDDSANDIWTKSAERQLDDSFGPGWAEDKEAKFEWFDQVLGHTTNATAVDYFRKERDDTKNALIIAAGDGSPEAEAVAEKSLMENLHDGLEAERVDLGMTDFVKVYGTNSSAAAQQLVKLFPAMTNAVPHLEPYLFAAVISFQTDTNAPIIAEFQRRLPYYVKNSRRIINADQFWLTLRYQVYGWSMKSAHTDYALAAQVMEAILQATSKDTKDPTERSFKNQAKIALAVAYENLERWQPALDIFESFSNQPVMMENDGPWGPGQQPFRTSRAAAYCRQKMGQTPVPDPRELKLDQPFFSSFTPIAFAVENNGVWIATGGQLLHLDFDLKTNLTLTLPIDSDVPISCLCLGTSNLWIGTYGGGLIEFDKASHRFRQLTEKDGLMMNEISALHLTGQTLWIGYGQRTYYYYERVRESGGGGGLGQLDLSTDRFTSYTLSLANGADVRRHPAGILVPEQPDKPTCRTVIAIADETPDDVWFIAESFPPSLRCYRKTNNSWEFSMYDCSCLTADSARLFVGHYANTAQLNTNGFLNISVLDFKTGQRRELKAVDALMSGTVSTLLLKDDDLWVGGLGYIALVDWKQDKILKFAYVKTPVVNHIQVGGGYLWARFNSCLYRTSIP